MAQYREQLDQYRGPARAVSLLLTVALLLWMGILTWQGFSRLQQPTQEQVAGISPAPPRDLGLGPTPAGGPSEAPTGAGAGGSAAAGYQTGRVGSSIHGPTTPDYPYGVAYSRMSPVASDGSSAADRGRPLRPDQPLVARNAVGVTQPIFQDPQALPPNVNLH